MVKKNKHKDGPPSPPPAPTPPKHPAAKAVRARREKSGTNWGAIVSVGVVIGVVGYVANSFMSKGGDYNLADDEGGYQAVKKWIIEEHKGHVTPNVEQSYGPDPDNTLRGLFVKNRMKKGEAIFRMPFSALMLGNNHCESVKLLADEMRLGSSSSYWPYIKNFVKSPLTMPNVWTTDEQQLLKGFPPYDVNRHTRYFNHVCANKTETGMMTLDDSYVYEAFFHVVARTSTCIDYICMVPIYDMANHIHKEGLNTVWEIEVDRKKNTTEAVLSTSRVLQPGEEIHTFYAANSPNMLSQYGFLDAFPREWWFRSDGSIKEDEAHKFKLYEDGRIVIKSHQPTFWQDAYNLLEYSLEFERSNEVHLAAKRFYAAYQHKGWSLDVINFEDTYQFTTAVVGMAINYRDEFNKALKTLFKKNRPSNFFDAKIYHGAKCIMDGDTEDETTPLAGLQGNVEEVVGKNEVFIKLPDISDKQIAWAVRNGLFVRDFLDRKLTRSNHTKAKPPISILGCSEPPCKGKLPGCHPDPDGALTVELDEFLETVDLNDLEM